MCACLVQEEIRSRLPKYRVAKISSQPAVSMPEARMLQPPLQGGAPPLGRPQMNAPPIIRPGMGPPPPMNPNLSPMRPNIVRPGMGPPPTMAMMPPRPNFAPPQIHWYYCCVVYTYMYVSCCSIYIKLLHNQPQLFLHACYVCCAVSNIVSSKVRRNYSWEIHDCMKIN